MKHASRRAEDVFIAISALKGFEAHWNQESIKNSKTIVGWNAGWNLTVAKWSLIYLV